MPQNWLARQILQESNPEVDQGTGGVIPSPICLGLEPAELSEVADSTGQH